MTRENIIRMAREAEIGPVNICELTRYLERFAALIAAAEREACADIADSMDPLQDGAIGQAIRARGQA